MRRLTATDTFSTLTIGALLAIFCLSLQWPIRPVEAHAQSKGTENRFSIAYGPYNGIFLPDGKGLIKQLPKDDAVFRAGSRWTIYCWIRADQLPRTPTLLAGFGDPLDEYSHYFGVVDSKLVFRIGAKSVLTSGLELTPGAWHLLLTTFDGKTTRFYVDGEPAAKGTPASGPVSAMLEMAPDSLPWSDGKHFGGKIAQLTIGRNAMNAQDVKALFAQPVNFSVIEFEEGSKSWPIQTQQETGYRAPQDPSTMPKSAAPFSKPVVRVKDISHGTVLQDSADEWTLAGDWKLAAAPKVHAAGPQIAQVGFDSSDWLAATVPGTVLTTMVDQGIYPDPDYGLNNLDIPESLNKQDYWYRLEFIAPKVGADQHSALTFNGINYAATVWLNGQRLGNIKGAFIRGVFDVTGVLKPGQANALAVQVSPPPHPGIPNEQSIAGGPGENGGIMCLDGPTFVATEGWDWIPGIRDRDTGIWQDVRLKATGSVKIGDPQVVTTLPLPDTSRADVAITVPLDNVTTSPIDGTLEAHFGTVTVDKHVVVAPGGSMVKLTPAEFSQLMVMHPRLWWPNGYGKPDLYQLKLQFVTASGATDSKELHFGIREITYELSLLDASGYLRRVEYSPTVASEHGEKVVDVSHRGIREIPDGWVASLEPGEESSPALRDLTDVQISPYLVIKVNGVRIAARGGNWGMDDSRKRVSRERLEPYFRLQRDANINIIRNWVGQNTEKTFFDLADEYGLLVWNDFWESTQDDNVEPDDPALFLANARDTILRFRNHPSIVMWCGRNEGVPQPVINDGLEELVRSLDGTRYYSPSSNQINLQKSGPYSYQDPRDYYTTLNKGFSVETGTPSMPTLESFRSFIPKPDQWPISDNWAYHDWHQKGNGDTASFMRVLQDRFGAATSLEDFERKTQMLNYVSYRAIFEGFNAHLWSPNSGRLLWMSQPAWPSTNWQILSSDYDTQASFYGVKKACEPVHVQMDLSNYNVEVVNTTTTSLADLSVRARVYSLSSKLLLDHEQTLTANSDATSNAFPLALGPQMARGMVFVRLELKDKAGKVLSDNFYWLGAIAQSYRALDTLPTARLTSSATSTSEGDETHVHVRLENHGESAALAAKLTLENSQDGSRILPAYLSDNYISLLPGESEEIEITYSSKAAHRAAKVGLRGWNVAPGVIAVSAR